MLIFDSPWESRRSWSISEKSTSFFMGSASDSIGDSVAGSSLFSSVDVSEDDVSLSDSGKSI